MVAITSIYNPLILINQYNFYCIKPCETIKIKPIGSVETSGKTYQAKEKKGRMKFFLCVMGMVMIIEGLPYFAFPNKMKQMVSMVLGMEEAALRRFGFVLMVSGLFIVYMTMGGQ